MSSTLKCSTCNIVICELLAFIQNKQDVMDEKSLVTLCLSSFSSEDIDEAKTLLFTAVSQRKIKRKKVSRSYKDLYDVITVFKETSPEDLPVFVAMELQKLPPLTFDHIDASRLLKDVIVLKSELQAIKADYVTQKQLQDTKAEMTNLKYASIVSEPDYFVNKKRGGGCQNSYCLDSGPLGLPHISHISQTQQPSEPVIMNQHSPSRSQSGVRPRSSPLSDKNSTAALVAENNVKSLSNLVHHSTPETMTTTSKTLADIVAVEGDWQSKEKLPTEIGLSFSINE